MVGPMDADVLTTPLKNPESSRAAAQQCEGRLPGRRLRPYLQQGIHGHDPSAAVRGCACQRCMKKVGSAIGMPGERFVGGFGQRGLDGGSVRLQLSQAGLK